MSLNLTQTFTALSDPARRELVITLSKEAKTAGQLAAPYKISRPAISRHLRVLREAGLVTVEVRGRQHWYALEPLALQEAEQWLNEVANTWKDGLAALKHFVEAEE